MRRRVLVLALGLALAACSDYRDLWKSTAPDCRARGYVQSRILQELDLVVPDGVRAKTST
jgi:hypothetical protein